MKYLALLRSINVGGKNTIKMDALRVAFESAGFQNVMSYIQSGNVIFETAEKDPQKLTEHVEKLLSENFHYDAKVVLLSHGQFKKILAEIPRDWKTHKDLRCYIAFVKEPMTAAEVAKEIKINSTVDSLKCGPQALYMSTLMSGLMKSGFTKMIGTKVYKEITMRNLRTSEQLLEMMEAR